MECGEIVFVRGFVGENGQYVKPHAFVIINNQPGEKFGLPFREVGLMLCSIHDEEHRKHALHYSGNIHLQPGQAGSKEGYVKCRNLYYFNLEEAHCRVVGKMDPSAYDQTIKQMSRMIKTGKAQYILQNLVDPYRKRVGRYYYPRNQEGHEER